MRRARRGATEIGRRARGRGGCSAAHDRRTGCSAACVNGIGAAGKNVGRRLSRHRSGTVGAARARGGGASLDARGKRQS